MLYTYLVVDMQSDFAASMKQETIAANAREIKAARAAGNPIIFFELPFLKLTEPPLQPTRAELLALVDGYGRAKRLTKSPFGHNGPKVMYNFASDIIVAERIVVGGVNTDDCVLWLAAGLPEYFPDAEVFVIQDACNTASGEADPWRLFAKEAPHARLLPTGPIALHAR